VTARCYAHPADWSGESVVLSPGESRHLFRVLRAREGDTVVVFDGAGREALAVAGGESSTVRLCITDIRNVPRRAVSITLVQALPKGRKMDLIIEKGTELGVSTISPVITSRTVAHPSPEKKQARIARWEQIAVGAAKQCGRSWLPRITPVTPYRDVLDTCRGLDLFLAATLEGNPEPLRNVLSRKGGRDLSSVGILIGPEGDLSAEEVEIAGNAGAVPVNLGRLVLRTETAALYALSVLNYEFGDRRGDS
jgi:16S rRNA (uracil1498-N3)-methyltransferase